MLPFLTGDALAVTIQNPAPDTIIRLADHQTHFSISGVSRLREGQIPVFVDFHDKRRSGLFATKTWEGSGSSEVSLADGALVFRPAWGDRVDQLVVKAKVPTFDINAAGFAVDIWLPAAYVRDEYLVIEPFVTDANGYYAALVYAQALLLEGDTWNALRVAKLDRRSFSYIHPNCDLQNISFVGIHFQARGKDVAVTGAIKIDNFTITGVNTGPPQRLDFTALKRYETKTEPDGSWALEVPAADLQSLPREITLTAHVGAGTGYDGGQHAIEVKNLEAQPAGRHPRDRRWRHR